MTLIDFIDDHFLEADILVYAVNGAEIGTIFQGNEESLSSVRGYLRGNIVRDGRASDGTYWAYVSAEPPAPERGPVVQGYPGEVKDEAAFSLDWRAREPKASTKQLAFLYNNLRLYAQIRKPQWPKDPQQLLRYEASDAMTMIIELKKSSSRGRKKD
jgi:hypothetical protein